jgi:hypothetical protein
MIADAQLVVVNGVHTGARMVLRRERPVRIGSGSGADLMVIDEGVKPLHATATLQGGGLALVAHQPDVAVFGRRIPAQRRVFLRLGARFSTGAITFQFSGPDGASATMTRQAERAYLLRHAPLSYVAKRWSDTPSAMKGIVVGAPLAFALLAWISSSQMSGAPQAVRVNDAFRLVTTHPDPKSGAVVYEGYVQTAADLSALTASAWSRQRVPVMRVIVLENLQEQVGEFLARYYRGALVRAAEPGVFAAELPDPHGFLSAESWDYVRVARLARADIIGLRELTFPGHAQVGERVRVPLETLGMNLLVGRHAVWLADGQGTRYFAGARLPMGRIKRISACAAEVTRDDDDSVYEFFTDAKNGQKNCR